MPALDFPASPTNGQVFGNWIYSTAKGAWQSKPLTPAKTVNSPTAPTSPADGDQWFNTNTGQLFIYFVDANGGQWVESRAPITADGYVSPNYVINGGFDIWQRGTSFSNLNNAYTADRWFVSFSGSGSTRSITRQTFTPGTSVGQETNFFINLSQTVAGTGATWNEFATLIEDVRTLAGKTATFSFWAKSSNSSFFTGIFLGQVFQGSGRFDSPVAPAGNNIQLTSTWTRYSYTFTVPSISGKTIGSGSHLFLAFQLPLNATHNIDIANVQLEEGSVATPFRRNGPSIEAELVSCMRYYQYLSQSEHVDMPYITKISPTATGINTSGGYGTYYFAVPLRASPSVTFSAASTFTCHVPGVTIGSPGGISATGSKDLMQISVSSVAAGFTFGQAVDLQWTGTGGRINISAEM